MANKESNTYSPQWYLESLGFEKRINNEHGTLPEWDQLFVHTVIMENKNITIYLEDGEATVFDKMNRIAKSVSINSDNEMRNLFDHLGLNCLRSMSPTNPCRY